MTDQPAPASTAPLASSLPHVQGRCPACRWTSLFLGAAGHVTCARIDCPNPCAADQLLHGEIAHDGPTVAECAADDKRHWGEREWGGG